MKRFWMIIATAIVLWAVLISVLSTLMAAPEQAAGEVGSVLRPAVIAFAGLGAAGALSLLISAIFARRESTIAKRIDAACAPDEVTSPS